MHDGEHIAAFHSIDGVELNKLQGRRIGDGLRCRREGGGSVGASAGCGVVAQAVRIRANAVLSDRKQVKVFMVIHSIARNTGLTTITTCLSSILIRYGLFHIEPLHGLHHPLLKSVPVQSRYAPHCAFP